MFSPTEQWTRPLGTPADDVANGIATDAQGNVYMTESTGEVSMATPTLANLADTQ